MYVKCFFRSVSDSYRITHVDNSIDFFYVFSLTSSQRTSASQMEDDPFPEVAACPIDLFSVRLGYDNRVECLVVL